MAQRHTVENLVQQQYWYNFPTTLSRHPRPCLKVCTNESCHNVWANISTFAPVWPYCLGVSWDTGPYSWFRQWADVSNINKPCQHHRCICDFQWIAQILNPIATCGAPGHRVATYQQRMTVHLRVTSARDPAIARFVRMVELLMWRHAPVRVPLFTRETRVRHVSRVGW